MKKLQGVLKMKKQIAMLLSIAIGSILPAADPTPVLSYDFSVPEIGISGKYKKPVPQKMYKIGMPEYSLILSDRNYLTVPESASFSLKEGGTLHAIVYFNGFGKSQQDKDYDMVFWKRGEFLLGRSKNLCYFNAGDGTKWMMNVHAGRIALKQWTVLTVVLTKKDDELYNVKMFINGKMCITKDFRAQLKEPNQENIIIGQGFGGPWALDGKIAKVMIFDSPLSDDSVKALVAQSDLHKKGFLE